MLKDDLIFVSVEPEEVFLTSNFDTNPLQMLRCAREFILASLEEKTNLLAESLSLLNAKIYQLEEESENE